MKKTRDPKSHATVPLRRTFSGKYHLREKDFQTFLSGIISLLALVGFLWGSWRCIHHWGISKEQKRYRMLNKIGCPWKVRQLLMCEHHSAIGAFPLFILYLPLKFFDVLLDGYVNSPGKIRVVCRYKPMLSTNIFKKIVATVFVSEKLLWKCWRSWKCLWKYALFKKN